MITNFSGVQDLISAVLLICNNPRKSQDTKIFERKLFLRESQDLYLAQRRRTGFPMELRSVSFSIGVLFTPRLYPLLFSSTKGHILSTFVVGINGYFLV